MGGQGIEKEKKLLEEMNEMVEEFSKPPSSRKTCESFKEGHSYLKDGAYYIIEIERSCWGLTKYTFSTRDNSNMMKILVSSMKDGTLKSVINVPIKEYALAGGHNVPCCMRNCPYDVPVCVS